MSTCIKFFWDENPSWTFESESSFFSDQKNTFLQMELRNFFCPIAGFAAMVVIVLFAFPTTSTSTASTMENRTALKFVSENHQTMEILKLTELSENIKSLREESRDLHLKLANFNMTEINENIKGLRVESRNRSALKFVSDIYKTMTILNMTSASRKPRPADGDQAEHQRSARRKPKPFCFEIRFRY